MTLIKPYLSSSDANLYTVDDGRTKFILECGCTFKRMQDLLGFRTAGYAGCLITHEHSDHSLAATQLARRGVAIYATPGTLEALRLAEYKYNVVPMEYGKPYMVSTLEVMAFPTIHNAAQPCGFVVTSRIKGETLVFATDTYKIGYRFEGATEIAVECNYSKEMFSDELPDAVKRRIMHSHMSLESCRDFLLAQDLKTVRRIWLVHLSAQRSNAELFRREIQRATGIRTVVAES